MKWFVPTELNFGVKTTLFTGLKSGAIKQNRSYGTIALVQLIRKNSTTATKKKEDLSIFLLVTQLGFEPRTSSA